MKIIDIPQNSLEWLNARAGIPTASEWDALVTPKFEIRKGKMVTTYLAQKVAEAWTQSPIANFMGIDMEFGQVLETEAIPWFENFYDTAIQRVGFITTDDGKLGCSPDGLLGHDSGIEIKCPLANTHAKYLLAGELPEEYVHQVHGSMLVTGFSSWTFFSYRRGFPPLKLIIERDEKIIAVMCEALDAFLEKFNSAMNRLTELNGGPPVRHDAMQYEPDNRTATLQEGDGIH
jgi:hypothetical protein